MEKSLYVSWESFPQAIDCRAGSRFFGCTIRLSMMGALYGGQHMAEENIRRLVESNARMRCAIAERCVFRASATPSGSARCSVPAEIVTVLHHLIGYGGA
jgi:hypothetical protein